MIYIRSIGLHNTLPADAVPDLAHELKTLSGKVYRRTNHFIQLAVLGAHKAAHGLHLPEQTAIYMTSGQGNISVFDQICTQRLIHHMLPRPVDFINLLSNSAGFYVAAHLGLHGKNISVTHHRFPVQMMLTAARNDIVPGKSGAEKMVLVGAVDEWIPQQKRAAQLMGVAPETPLGEGSNWMLLSAEPGNSLGRLEIHPRTLNAKQLDKILASAGAGTRVSFSFTFPANEAAAVMKRHRHCRRFRYEDCCGYYETLSLYVLNRFVSREKGRLIHIEGNRNHAMIMMVSND